MQALACRPRQAVRREVRGTRQIAHNAEETAGNAILGSRLDDYWERLPGREKALRQ